MTAVSPVIKGQTREIVLGANQPQYEPLPVLVGDGPECRMTMRFRLDEEQRAAVLAGADLMVTVLTFGKSFHPLLAWFASEHLEGEALEQAKQIAGVTSAQVSHDRG